MIVLSWVPVILWTGLIFWMSTDTFSSQNTSLIIEPLVRFLLPGISERSLALIHGFVRKAAHLTEYFILALLLFRAFRRTFPQAASLRLALRSLLIVALVAVGDEFHQSFVATRTASVLDVGIDTVGGLLALGVMVFRSRSSH
ncbi:MAG TPA: VanZ family protein [Thermodesulfovibrionales bacterium]|nr:VanZ family protein [Thermodesulfovibrionales bacterium]